MDAGMAARKTVESFVLRVVHDLDDECVLLVLLPWTRLPVPPGVLVPMRHPQEGIIFNQRDLDQLSAKNPRIVLIPCTFESEAEEESASRLLPQLMAKCSENDDVCVFLIYLFQQELEDDEGLDIILERHSKMIQLHPDDVIVNPTQDPEAFNQTIRITRLNWSMNVQRIQTFLAEEPEPVDPQMMKQLNNHHRRLLWESIPRVLMRNFVPMDRNIDETSRGVGSYRFFRPLRTVQGTVIQAIDQQDQQHELFAVKVIDKSRVHWFTQLEGIYREYGFLAHKIDHPNIVRCVAMLHTLNRLYFVFEFAGNQNLRQLLESRPGERLENIERYSCIKQIIAALSYCHGQGITHRLVSLEHIVLMEVTGPERFRCRLVDFQGAVESHAANTMSITVCGTLPTISPEVALGGPYSLRFVDGWSAGVVFIEMAGGLDSMQNCIGYDPQQFLESAMAIQDFFRSDDCHSRILRHRNADEQDPNTLQIVQMLVQTNPEERAEIQRVEELEFLQNAWG